MKKLLALAPCTALLFACGGGSSVSLQPGQWETTVQFTNVEVPGAPEAQLAAMRQAMSRAQTQSQCITQEQAANPMGNMMGQAQQGCNFTRNTFSGGTIDVAGTCSPPGGAQATLTMTGSYTADTITGNINSEVRAPASAAAAGGPQQVRMSGTFRARRTGDCPGGNR
jgi:hypothetical protein